MEENVIIQLKRELTDCLNDFRIHELRPYGRELGLHAPTKLTIDVLISEIVGVLLEEKQPSGRSNRGKPPKNCEVNPKIIAKVNEIMAKYFPEKATFEEPPLPKFDMDKLKKAQGIPVQDTLSFEEPQYNLNGLGQTLDEVFVGQLHFIKDAPRLLPTNCREEDDKNLFIPVALVEKYALRAGDVVSCHAAKSGTALVATNILTQNGICVEFPPKQRVHFEDCEVAQPEKRICFSDKQVNGMSMRFMDAFIPLGRGQRGLIISSPKAGKSTLLYQLATAAESVQQNVTVLALLLGQQPETVGLYRSYFKPNIVMYTTYEDEPDKQVFAARFFLERAKRLVESGRDVLLVIDSLNELAHVFNETDASVGGKVLTGGMESKTIRFIKSFFGTARRLKNGGSLTILGTLSNNTGNPADDLLCGELSTCANLEIRLSEQLALQRTYPAFELENTRVMQELFTPTQDAMDRFIRKEYLPKFGNGALIELFKSCQDGEEFFAKARKTLSDKS